MPAYVVAPQCDIKVFLKTAPQNDIRPLTSVSAREVVPVADCFSDRIAAMLK